MTQKKRSCKPRDYASQKENQYLCKGQTDMKITKMLQTNPHKGWAYKVTPFLICLLLFLSRDVSAFCFEEAGAKYGIDPLLLRTIAKVESDLDPVAINWNRNGTYDYGLMQINSQWADKIGVDLWMALGEPCMNVKMGAWILAQCLQKYGNNWRGIGCYHSVKRDRQKVYASKINRVLRELRKTPN